MKVILKSVFKTSFSFLLHFKTTEVSDKGEKAILTDIISLQIQKEQKLKNMFTIWTGWNKLQK